MSQISLNGRDRYPIVLEMGFNFVAPSVGAGGASTEVKEVLSASLSAWTLTGIPTAPHLSKFFINGQKQTFGTDYVINGAIVAWLGYALKPGWQIDIYYS